MTTRPCKNCDRPVELPGPAYCSEPCWETAARCRRRVAAARSRSRRRALNRTVTESVRNP